MTESGDFLVMIMLIFLVTYFIYNKLHKRWLSWKKTFTPRERSLEYLPSGEVSELLHEHGFFVFKETEDCKISINFNNELYDSYIKVDYLAKKDDDWYIVMVENTKRKLRLNGHNLRKRFFVYHLIWQPTGILYIDLQRKEIQTINIIAEINLHRMPKALNKGYIILGILFLIFFGWICRNI